MYTKGIQPFRMTLLKLTFLVSFISKTAISQACFNDLNLPKFFQAKTIQSESQFTAITGSESLYSLFIGGSTTSIDLNNAFGGTVPALARVDLNLNKYTFFKTYQG